MPRFNTVKQCSEEDRANKGTRYSTWYQIVRYYSRCGLTKPTLSLSMELQKLTGDEYHFGHWLHHSHWVLLLYIESSLGSSGLYLLIEITCRTCSLMVLGCTGYGPLDFLDMHGEHLADFIHDKDTDMEVLKLSKSNRPGASPTMALSLEGAIFRVSRCRKCVGIRWKPSKQCSHLPANGRNIPLTIFNEYGGKISGSFKFDLADIQPTHFWLLPMFIRCRPDPRPFSRSSATTPAPEPVSALLQEPASKPAV